MTRRLVATAALLALLAVAPAAALAAEGDEGGLGIEDLDASSYPDVTMTVSVPAELAGVPLDSAAFTVTENGERRTVAATPVATDGLEVVLVLDASTSMKGEPLTAAKDAAKGFLGVLPSTVQVAVVSFASTPEVLSEFSTDREDSAAAIDSIDVAGETALYDGVVAGAGLFDGRGQARRVVVLLSDGGDTVSQAPVEDAIAALLAAGISFYAVELQSPENDGAGIARMAAATDGTVVPAEDPAALAGVFETVGATIANQYVLTYTSRAHDDVEVGVAVEASGVTASSTWATQFPAAAAPATTPDPVVEVPAEPAVDPFAVRGGSTVELAWYQTSRGLLLGAGAIFLAIAGVVLLAGRGSRSTIDYGVAFAMAERLRSTKKSAVTNFAHGATAIVERSLQGERARGLNDRLDRAGLAMRPGEFVVMVGGFALGALAVGLVLFDPLAGLGAAVMTVLFFRWRLSAKAAKRNRAFAEQLPDALQLMSGSLRAGFGFLQAVSTVGNEVAAPCGDEFRRVKVETQLGKDVDDALREMAARVDSEDFKWVVEAIEIHREVGGDLSDILTAVTETIRDRNSIRRRIQALSAEGKISGVVLGGMPFVLAIVIMFLNPTYLQELLDSAMGIAMIVGGLVAMVVGIAWMRRITNLKF